MQLPANCSHVHINKNEKKVTWKLRFPDSHDNKCSDYVEVGEVSWIFFGHHSKLIRVLKVSFGWKKIICFHDMNEMVCRKCNMKRNIRGVEHFQFAAIFCIAQSFFRTFRGGCSGKNHIIIFYFRVKKRSFVWFPCPICIEYHMIIPSVLYMWRQPVQAYVKQSVLCKVFRGKTWAGTFCIYAGHKTWYEGT